MKKNARPPHVSNSYNGLHLHFFFMSAPDFSKKSRTTPLLLPIVSPLLLPLLLILLLILLLPLLDSR